MSTGAPSDTRRQRIGSVTNSGSFTLPPKAVETNLGSFSVKSVFNYSVVYKYSH